MSTSALQDGDARMVTALFKDRNSAERAYRAAAELGYDKADITVVISAEARNRHFPDDAPATELSEKASKVTSKTPEGADLGGPISGTVGTLAPAAAAAGAVLLIPGIIFAGPVAVALTAAAAVALTGGLVGALAKWGIPAERVQEYEVGVREGGIVLGVKARNAEDAGRLEKAWSSAGGQLIHS
jgi:hypothetical protein